MRAVVVFGGREVFKAKGDPERIASNVLGDALKALPERPWEPMPKTGKGITPQARGRMLADYGIHAKTLRFGDGKDAKGYERASFVEAWAGYLSDGDGLRTVEPLTCLERRHFRDSRTVDGNSGVNGSGDAENPEKRGVSTVQRFERTGERESRRESARAPASLPSQPPGTVSAGAVYRTAKGGE